MLRRFGPLALTIGSLLMGAEAANGQAPVGTASADGALLTTPVADAMGGPAPMGASGGNVRTAANFDPYALQDEMRGAAQQTPQAEMPGDKYRAGGCGACADGKGRGLLKGGLFNGHGPLNGGKLFGGLGGKGDGKGDGADDPNFDCANCWSFTNIEKKFFINYAYDGALRTATKAGYGTSNGAEVGIEFLPWVCRDDERHFTRWGFITAFDYREYNGNKNAVLVSDLSGNTVSSDGGQSYGFILAPVLRSDIFLFGHRVSPSLALGMDFDWVAMREAIPTLTINQPVFQVPVAHTFTPVSNIPQQNSTLVHNIDRIKDTGFNFGGYGKFLLDVPITQKLNFGIGMDVRYVASDVFLRRDEVRKHFGLVLQLSKDF